MSNNNKIKLPPWALVLFFLFFFGGIVLTIAGDAMGVPPLRGFGIAMIFGGMAVVIILSQIFAHAKRNDEDFKDVEFPFDDRDDYGVKSSSIDRDSPAEREKYMSDRQIADRLSDKTPRTDVEEVMKREDLLYMMFERKGLDDLADEYESAADAYWQEYAGDTWDDNVAAIDALIDEYYAKIEGDEPAASDEQNDDKPNVFDELFAADKPEQSSHEIPASPDRTLEETHGQRAVNTRTELPERAPAAHRAPVIAHEPVAADHACASPTDTAEIPPSDTADASLVTPPLNTTVSPDTAAPPTETACAPTSGTSSGAGGLTGTDDTHARTKSTRIGYKRIGKK